MKLQVIKSDNSRRLLLIFAGWGMDANPFTLLTAPDCDITVAYDYSDLIISQEAHLLNKYEEVMIMAWSYGVIAADIFIASHPQLPITQRIAINGTLYPAHDRFGIPPAIFLATLNNLSEASVKKFRRRMCGNSSTFAAFEAHAPARSVESLRAELFSISKMNAAHSAWDLAYISSSDAIIPPDNQRAAWQAEGVTCIETEWPHIPDMQAIIDRHIIDKQLVARRFARAAATYGANANIQRQAAIRLNEIWRKNSAGTHPNPNVIEVGAGTGQFTREYIQWLQPTSLTLWDIADIAPTLPGQHTICDAETEIAALPDSTTDVIAAASTIQWFSSPREFIRQTHRVLRPGGLLLLSSFGPENFKEITACNYPPLATLTAWIDASGFELIDHEESHTVLSFESPAELLRHIKHTGVNALSHKAANASAARDIIRRNITRLTYHTIIVAARRR